MTDIQILKRLYNDYTKKFLNKIILSAFFSILVAGSTSDIGWLLDHAIFISSFKQSRRHVWRWPRG